MSEKEREEFIAYIEEYTKKMIADKKLARDFYIRAGILTKKGKLAAPYKHLYIPQD